MTLKLFDVMFDERDRNLGLCSCYNSSEFVILRMYYALDAPKAHKDFQTRFTGDSTQVKSPFW